MKKRINYKVKSKRILIRTDYDVPIINQKVNDYKRLKDSANTIKWLMNHGAHVIICSSLGRPRYLEKKLSLNQIVQPLSEILETKVLFSENCIGTQRNELIRKLNKNEVLLLENVRFYKEEYDNDTFFSHQLSKNIDIYINDAFGNSHRKHASMVGVIKHINKKTLGFHIQNELIKINNFLQSRTSPRIGIIGGNKLDKIDIIEYLIHKLDKIIIIGELSKFFIYSAYSNFLLEMKKEIYKKCLNIYNSFYSYNKIILPIDLIMNKCNISHFLVSDLKKSNIFFDDFHSKFSFSDIGPRTKQLIDQIIHNSKQLIWNGPAGKYENKLFNHGSKSIVKSINSSNIQALIGGGDTLAVLKNTSINNPNIHTVSGGGALLTILKGNKLIAVENIFEKQSYGI